MPGPWSRNKRDKNKKKTPKKVNLKGKQVREICTKDAKTMRFRKRLTENMKKVDNGGEEVPKHKKAAPQQHAVKRIGIISFEHVRRKVQATFKAAS